MRSVSHKVESSAIGVRRLMNGWAHGANRGLRHGLMPVAVVALAGVASHAAAGPITGANGANGVSVSAVTASGAGGDGANNSGSGGVPTPNTGGTGVAGSGGNGAGGGAGGLNVTFSPYVTADGGTGGNSQYGTGGAGGTVTTAASGGGEEAGGGGGFGGSSSNSAGAGGGGGGGRGATISTATATILATDPVTGGIGGKGGAGLGPYGDGGGGGGGGIGVVFSGSQWLIVNGTITGGKGGDGGDGSLNARDDTYGASGGTGGSGLRVSQPNVTVTVNAAITGGQGGIIGQGLHTPIKAKTGVGGAGVVGAGVTIINNAVISGGMSGDSTKRANAITLTGGSNVLTLGAGWGLAGNIGITDAAATLTFQQSTIDATVSNIITGTGKVDVNDGGSGFAVTLSGISTYTGATTVTAGKLVVNGSIATSSGITVKDGGVLGGSGNVSALTVASGGTLSPGNSIGTTHAASAAFDAGSIYEVEVDSAGNADLLDVTGNVTITGGTVVVRPFPDYVTGSPYKIVTAGGSITGGFGDVDFTAGSLFLSGALSQDAHNVYVTLGLTDFSAVADTPNQAAAADGAQSLGAGNPVYDAIFALTSPADAQAAFDALSGEVHATVAGVAVDDSRYVRDALLARLRTAAPSNGPAMWGQGYGAEASLGGDGNAASLARSVAGFIAGIDTAADATWRAGVAAGYSRGDVRITDRASAARLVGYHLAGYFGGTLGPVVLRSGAAWTWNDIDTSRTVAFPGFADQLTASYRGNLGQVFAEAALPMAAAGAKWEPYARLVYVDANNAAFSENRGAAALKADGVHASAGYATLGLRIDGTMEVGGAGFTPYASFAWQHTLGNLDPAATLAFVSGGQPFTVLGTPLARDSALIDLGVTLDIAQQASLGVAYSGRFASSLSDNAVNGRFDWRF